MKQYFEIGVLWRGKFRRLCTSLGLDYKEDKGFLDSSFVVSGDRETIQKLKDWIDYLNGPMEIKLEGEGR